MHSRFGGAYFCPCACAPGRTLLRLRYLALCRNLHFTILPMRFALLVFRAQSFLSSSCVYMYRQQGEDGQCRTGQPKQQSQSGTSRTGQADRTDRTGQAFLEGRTGQAEQDCQDSTARKGLSGLHCQDRASLKGLLGQDG